MMNAAAIANIAAHFASQSAPVVAPAATLPTGPAFWANDEATFTPKRGFETVLWNALNDGALRTEAELVTAIMPEFERVAPKAAANRPTKPTRFLLKTWTNAGLLKRTN